jgi:hypothetical protein
MSQPEDAFAGMELKGRSMKEKRKPFTAHEAKEIGDKLGIDWAQTDIKQFQRGMNAELEDGTYNPVTNFASDDPILVGKVVRAHLKESPDYYARWARMEKKAEHDHGSQNTITRAEETMSAE